MMRSLFSGVTGLRSHQTRMDVIGNNIANVNTVGFKKSAVTFKDLYSETISAAAGTSGAGQGASGGVNPQQIGLGAAVSSISVVHTPGAAQYTGNGMDVAISGSGYFVVETPAGLKYTRAGNFYTDTSGNLVTAQGNFVKVVDPIMTSDLQYILKNISTNGLFVANSPITKPESNVQSGSITADLSQINGIDFGFEYRVDGNGYISNINVKYRPSVDEAAHSGYVVGKDENGNYATLDMKAIADSYLQAVPVGTEPGMKDVTIEVDAVDPNLMYLKVGGVTVSHTSLVDAVDDGNGRYIARASFPGIGDIYMESTAGGPLTVADQTALLTDLQNLPEIPLDESGGWWLVNKGTGEAIEQVNLTARTGVGGIGIASGDILFTTANYGSYRLRLTQMLSGNAELSSQLNDSIFNIEVEQEPYINYSSPEGTISEASLKNMQIDFSRYSNLAIDPKGAIIAQLKNDEVIEAGGRQVQLFAGDKVVLGYIALANFNNPTGLTKIGDNLYEVSANSGTAAFAMPGSASAGSLATSNLEMSNVDLSEEMVNMIITQRGFQANSRIITTSDTMLEELINLKR